MPMCEMIVMTQDKTHDDPYMDCKQLKRGDVVIVESNDHNWGVDEENNPLWKIVKFPNCSTAIGRTFLGSEKQLDAENPSLMLRPRAFSLDLDNLPSDLEAVTDTVLLQLKVEKIPLTDPNVLG